MATVTLSDLTFQDRGSEIRAIFMKSYYLDLPKSELAPDCGIAVESGALVLSRLSEKKALNRVRRAVQRSFGQLTNTLTRKPTTFISKESGVPLIGSSAFGIIDRNTNILEIRPVTGCNQNCNYCSVDEGLSTRKIRDFLIEPSYLAAEVEVVAKFKGVKIEAHINSQGEPTIYPALPELVQEIRSSGVADIISIDTNGSLLTEAYVDELKEAGLNRVNLSLNAFDERISKIMAGWGRYDVERIKEIATYIAGRMKLIIAPVYLPGFNDKELEKIVLFGKGIGAQIGIQNFLNYRLGRNPVTQAPWGSFYSLLRQLEAKTETRLLFNASDYNIIKTRPLPKPFKKKQRIDVNVVCHGRYPGEMIAAAGNRVITIPRGAQLGKARVRITRTKHNIFYASIKS